MQEFVKLIDECDLLSHREAIVKRGAALTEKAASAESAVPGGLIGMPRLHSEVPHVLSGRSSLDSASALALDSANDGAPD